MEAIKFETESTPGTLTDKGRCFINLSESTVKTDDKHIRFYVCVDCTPPHVTNCPQCFGYGLSEGGFPIAAGEVDDYQRDDLDYIPCGICKGTPYNKHIVAKKQDRV